MSRNFRMLAAIVLGSAMAFSTVPATVQADGGKILKECLADCAKEPDQKRVESECRWEYYEYMASYGK